MVSDQLSGTTASLAILDPRSFRCTVAHVSDSRIAVMDTVGNALHATRDHIVDDAFEAVAGADTEVVERAGAEGRCYSGCGRSYLGLSRYSVQRFIPQLWMEAQCAGEVA